MIKKSALPTFVVFLIFPLSGIATSFDCALAKTEVEKTICDNPRLSSLDELMAKAYSEAMTLASDKERLKAWHKDWLLRQRNACLETVKDRRESDGWTRLGVPLGECVAHAYVTHIDQLVHYQEASGAESPAVPISEFFGGRARSALGMLHGEQDPTFDSPFCKRFFTELTHDSDALSSVAPVGAADSFEDPLMVSWLQGCNPWEITSKPKYMSYAQTRVDGPEPSVWQEHINRYTLWALKEDDGDGTRVFLRVGPQYWVDIDETNGLDLKRQLVNGGEIFAVRQPGCRVLGSVELRQRPHGQTGNGAHVVRYRGGMYVFVTSSQGEAGEYHVVLSGEASGAKHLCIGNVEQKGSEQNKRGQYP